MFVFSFQHFLGARININMTFWKVSRPRAAKLSATTDTSTTEDESLYELTTLEIVMLVLTVLAFIGQFMNLSFGIVDHFTLKKVAARVQ